MVFKLLLRIVTLLNLPGVQVRRGYVIWNTLYLVNRGSVWQSFWSSMWPSTDLLNFFYLNRAPAGDPGAQTPSLGDKNVLFSSTRGLGSYTIGGVKLLGPTWAPQGPCPWGPDPMAYSIWKKKVAQIYLTNSTNNMISASWKAFPVHPGCIDWHCLSLHPGCTVMMIRYLLASSICRRPSWITILN